MPLQTQEHIITPAQYSAQHTPVSPPAHCAAMRGPILSQPFIKPPALQLNVLLSLAL